jgi:FMN phosphatase YigB (HAD superfamily)
LSEMLHVGDERESDFSGARAAGLEALLVDHKTAKLSGILLRLT